MQRRSINNLIVLVAVFVLIVQLEQSQCCLLCSLRLPPRPRPIDHFQLPSPDQLASIDSVDILCEKAKRLRGISRECRQQIAKIFCSLSELIDAKSADCNKSEVFNEQACVECVQHNAYIVHNNFWVVTWLDSIGKMPSAISEGNHYWLGEYEQCSDLKKSGAFDGRYCLLQVEVPDSDVDAGCPQHDPLRIDLGICSPESCSEAEVNRVLRSVSPYNLTTRCESPRQWPLASQVFIIVVVVWLLIIFAGTVVEVSDSESNSPSPDILAHLGRCVSLRQNGHAALRTKRSHHYHSVQGLQVLLTAFVVTANCYSYMMPYIENVLFSYDAIKSWFMQPLNNFSMHVDAIMAINALFTSLLVKNALVTTFDVKKAYLKRLLQILPAFAFIVGFMTLMFERLMSGPLWNHRELVDRCESSWWKNILFISNLFPINQTCVDGGYLLALEAQFFLILAPMLYLSNRYKKPVIIASILGICASTAYVFVIVFIYSLPPSIILTTEQIPDQSMEMYLNAVYTKPWSRAPAFLIGLLFSFIFVSDSKLDKIISIVILFLFVIVGLFIVFAIFPFALNMKASSQFLMALYASVHRSVWCAIICAMIYVCYRKSGREFGAFLEWRIFNPLSKLTYLVFVLSEPVSLFLFSSLHRPVYATHWSTFYIALGTIVLSYIVAIALDVLIARPMRNLLIFVIGPYLDENKSSYQKACTNGKEPH